MYGSFPHALSYYSLVQLGPMTEHTPHEDIVLEVISSLIIREGHITIRDTDQMCKFCSIEV